MAVAALALLAGPAPIHAQATLSSEVDTTLVTVGDRVELTVAVEHAPEAAVSWPDSLDVAPFEVVGTTIEPVRTRGGRATSSATISVTAFELGELEIPPVEVRVLGPDGREEVLETDRFGVEVVSVGVDESGDIREIRGPLAIPVGMMRILAVAVLFMLLGAAVYAMLRRLRGPDDGESGLEPPAPPRPPHEVALEELARLEASPLLADGRVKDFHIRVSEILRRYVEARFRVPALEMTTWEVLGGLQAARVDDGLRYDLRRFLDRCDLVKFAKARPDEAESLDVLRLGRELVERTIS